MNSTLSTKIFLILIKDFSYQFKYLFIQKFKHCNDESKKNPKVGTICSDKGVAGKKTARKGGGKNNGQLPHKVKNVLVNSVLDWQECQNKT
jgi:hypothetical protein